MTTLLFLLMLQMTPQEMEQRIRDNQMEIRILHSRLDDKSEETAKDQNEDLTVNDVIAVVSGIAALLGVGKLGYDRIRG